MQNVPQNFITSEAKLNEVLSWLAKQEYVFYDIETSGLDSSKNSIIGFGISDFNNGYYLPLEQYSVDSNSLQSLPGQKALALTLLNALQNKAICTFNGAFDIPFTKKQLNIDLLNSLHTDVLLLKHTVDEEFPFKLKEIAVQVFGYGAASEQRDLQAELKAVGATKHEIYKANVNTIGKYCVQDCLLTARLFKHYRRLLEQQGLEQFFYIDEVMPLYKHVTIPMEQYGLALDLPLMQKTLAEINVDIEQLEHSIQEQLKPLLGKFEVWFLQKDYPVSRSGNFAQGIVEYFGLNLPKTDTGKYSITQKNLQTLPDGHAKSVLLKECYLADEHIVPVQKLLAAKDHGHKPLFNLQSKHHLKKLFFDTLGLQPLSTTDLGSPQVDDEFIDSIKHKYAWANDLHIYNKLQKIRSTYIERFLEKQRDGIFYPSFFQHRTVSGRLAGDFQQLPRPISDGAEHHLVIKYTNVIRSFFIARQGKVFVDADYNSAEPRVFAYISGDSGLKAIFQQGYDFYSHIAIMTEKLSGVSSLKKAENYLGKVNPDKRQQAKAYSLGAPYGLSGYKLAFQLNCTAEQGNELIEQYLNAFPNLRKWMENTQKQTIQHGFMRSIGGRIRHLPRAKQYAEKYGTTILDSLQLWKDYNHDPHIYTHMKKVRRELKNYLNNANNFQIQATVASIINRASIQIAQQFKAMNLDAHIVAQIHDQLIVECGTNVQQLVGKIVQENMENCAKMFVLDVPIPAEPNFGQNLKESKGA